PQQWSPGFLARARSRSVRPPRPAPRPAPAPPPAPPVRFPQPVAPPHEDELAFIKSVTDDDKTAPSPRRASGAQFQPVIPADTPTANPNVPRAANPVPAPIVPEPAEDTDQDPDADNTLRCGECSTRSLPTAWHRNARRGGT